MRIALTANGPGEVAGWARPLLRALYARDPQLDAHVFLVPDDFATGREATVLRAFFPQASVYEPRQYLAFAFGRALPGAPVSVDVVQYLGGDLMHAVRLRKRLGGSAATYKFCARRYAAATARAFAVDEENAQRLRACGMAGERVAVVGNLAIDGALLEAEQPLEDGVPEDGVLVMPGSRRHEVEHLVPFFFTVALRAVRERPDVRVAFGISPFTDLDQVARAVERGGDPRVWAQRGRLVHDGERVFLTSLDGAQRFPVLRNALAAARRARLALTLPGTKCIELAALGVPTIALTPLNAPEKIAFNGPLTYLDRVPLVGVPLKRTAVMAVSSRFVYHAQPNIDAQEMLVRELHGTLTPGRVARVTLEAYEDRAWQRESGERLRGLYGAHAGVSERMAASLLALARSS